MNDLMTDQQGKISTLQSQLSSGVKNVTPSTDVKATTTSLKLSDVISKQDDYLANLKNLNVGYIEEETVMSGMVEMIRMMQDIAMVLDAILNAPGVQLIHLNDRFTKTKAGWADCAL